MMLCHIQVLHEKVTAGGLRSRDKQKSDKE